MSMAMTRAEGATGQLLGKRQGDQSPKVLLGDPFVCSFNKYLLSSHSVQATLLGAADSSKANQ